MIMFCYQMVCPLDIFGFSGPFLLVKGQTAVLLSPPVHMHGGLLCVAFCPSVCLSVCPSVCLPVCAKILEKKSLEKNSYLRNNRSRSKVKVTFNVKEKAGGLRPMSSCFIP